MSFYHEFITVCSVSRYPAGTPMGWTSMLCSAIGGPGCTVPPQNQPAQDLWHSRWRRLVKGVAWTAVPSGRRPTSSCPRPRRAGKHNIDSANGPQIMSLLPHSEADKVISAVEDRL